MKNTESKNTALLAAIENAARVIESSSDTPLLAGSAIQPGSKVIPAELSVKEIGQPLLAGSGVDSIDPPSSAAKQK